MPRKAIIIGAGPAGLTAAHEFLTRSDVKPIVLEKSGEMGGISRTARYKGNRIDIGGHRFFSKSDRVMEWWLARMPMQGGAAAEEMIAYQGKSRVVSRDNGGPDPDATDLVMLVRPRKSRIYFMRRFFEYPITLSKDTLVKLGLTKVFKIGMSYIRSAFFPIRNEKNLEEFFINRFGRELYGTFFKSYTEKVWGVPCTEISAEWGAQRVKGLSITKTIAHAVKKLISPNGSGGVGQKGVETSLIERFLYPKLGPGQMWETVAAEVKEMGGEIHTGWLVDRILRDGNRITGIEARHQETGDRRVFEGDYFFSTMPIKELCQGIHPAVPSEVREISDGLVYRDFVTVGLLVKSLQIHDDPRLKRGVKDNWIYIQEPDVRVGRLQVFNNWSEYMVADQSTTWLGLEYFCNEGDDLWSMADEDLKALGRREMARIGIVREDDVLDATVIRVEKTYPAYFGTYDRFDELRRWLDGIENLFLVGRNGMHRYNNQDHSMLTAMTAVDNILTGRRDKANLWDVNTEQEYHEEKK